MELMNRNGLEFLSDRHWDDEGNVHKVVSLHCACGQMILTYPMNAQRRKCPNCQGGRPSLPL
jgi:hypothetical protein